MMFHARSQRRAPQAALTNPSRTLPTGATRKAVKIATATASAVFAVALCAGMSPQTPQAEAQSSPDVAKALTSSQGTDTRAPEGGAKVVVFGDSHTAGTNAPLWADDRGCFRSNTAWPMQLQRKLGLAPGDLIDSSCWGSTINSGPNLHFSDQVRSASARGALGQRTEHIFIQLGFNDAWGTQVTMKDSVKHCLFDVAHGCGDEAVRAGAMQDPAAITGTHYADRVRQVVDYLKYYAPKAKITLVGYQEMVPPSGGEVCTNVAGQQARKADAPALVQAVNNIDRAQREAAEQLKLGFIDLKTASAGHSSCSADPWVNGVGDARATMMGGVWHPSVHAEEITGDIIAQYVRQ